MEVEVKTDEDLRHNCFCSIEVSIFHIDDF